jgi:hypothetical protein
MIIDPPSNLLTGKQIRVDPDSKMLAPQRPEAALASNWPDFVAAVIRCGANSTYR